MKPLLRGACVAIALVCRLVASPVAIGDPSFEGNSLTAGGYSFDLGPEWLETGGPNNLNGFEEYITGFAADGTDHLGMEPGHDVWQDLGVTYQANTRYTLTVATGNRSGPTDPANESQYLLADSTGAIFATGIFNASTIPAGTFADAPALVFDTPTAPAAVGKTIRILLQAQGGGRSHFDHIRLDAASLVAPGGATLENQPATAITATSATLNGLVTDIGNSAPAITLFWGTTNGGLNPAAWQHSQTLSGTHSGAFSASVSGLAAGTAYYFTARATNNAGDSWPLSSENFETLPLPPGVANLAATGIGAASATVGANVSVSGGSAPAVTVYYGPADGGTTAANWASSVSLGHVTGANTIVLSGLATGTTYHFRAYAENAGGGSWAPGSSSFSTLAVTAPMVENRAADGITGTTATVRGEVTATGGDTPAVTIFYGPANGGTNPANWAFSVDAGLQAGEFSHFLTGLSPSTTYYFRSRSTNAAGAVWAPDTRSFTTTALVPNAAVIHEFHYNPADNTSLEEFIELHNPGDSAIDLSGWSLSDAVTFTFPAGTTLPAAGYLIVAEKPSVILAKYGKSALGPWTGKLSSTGERIDLRDAGGVLKDRVDYGVGFPWPTAADGAGNSVELIHPGLDNDLGGSWRASGAFAITPVTYIASQATGWKYLKGTAEASNPVTDWRTNGFNDAAWLTGQAGIGYGDPGVITTLGDMQGGYASVYFRKTFTVPAGSIPRQLKLRTRIDDGCVVWINGVEVDRRYVAAGQHAYNYLAPASHENTSWDEILIDNADTFLFGGTNVIAVHGFNNNLGSSDFSMDLELLDTANNSPLPTPGALNSVAKAATAIPPQIRQVAHSPVTPAAGQAVAITARITDPDGVGTVTLAYQTVDPGSYIRLTDAAYATSWTTVPMKDNGSSVSGDATANDSTYTARIPANVQTHRRLVRYKITFTDDLGNSATVPYPDDQQPNFAYFVYNGVPSWTGAMRPTAYNGYPATATQAFPATLLESITPFHLIANATDVTNCQYNGSYASTRFRGTVIQRGGVYDHVEFRVRGIGSTYQSGKNKWNIFFNRARDYQAYDNHGNPYKETWNNLLINANASPWAAVHRGSGGVEEAVSHRIFQLAGMAAMNTQFMHLRVIDDAVEASPTDQYSGDLWGLYLGLEPTEGNFLDEHGLEDGNLYSIEGNGGDKKHQGPTQPVNSSDWSTFAANLAASGQTEQWYRDNVDLPSLYTFLALNRLIGNVDVRPGDNYRFYHRPSDNRWVIIPYDLDMQFIAAHHWGGAMDGVTVAGAPNVIRAISRHPNLAREYRNRCRELISLMASDGAANGGQVGQLVREYARFIQAPGQPLSWANLDAAMWNLHPRSAGGGANTGQSSHKGNFFRATYLDGTRGGLAGTVQTGSWIRSLSDADGNGFSDHDGMMQWFVNYATNTWPGGAWNRKAMTGIGSGTDSDPNRQLGYGYKYLEFEALNGGWINANANPGSAPVIDFPSKPVVTATGDSTFPVSDLRFTSSAFADPQGAGTYAATQWRIARISAPGISGHVDGTPCRYEIEATWTSPELTAAPGSFTFPYGIATAGNTYRVRVRHKDATGNWSYWSEPAQFAATTPPPGLLMHYWNFNAANLTNVTQTIGGGALSSVLTGGAALVADNGEDFTGENARNGNPPGNHLRVNNPLGATLTFALPTTGYESLVAKYETRRSGQGAGLQNVSYTTNGSTWTPLTTITVLDATPTLQVLDFRGIAAANDNPLFAVRIAFQQGAGGTAGNDRIDNFTIEGDALDAEPGTFAFWRNQHFSGGDLTNDAVSGPEATPAGDGISNIMRYAHGVGPYAPVAHLLPVLVKDGSAFEFRFRYDPSLTDLVWKVKASNHLGTWPSALFDSTIGPVPPLEGGWLPVTLPSSLTGNPSPDPKIFARLEVQLASP